ncbi:MCE family protein [Nocardia bovistercoris]|uniref:MCE family protein n=1 Tax=Nocardia bovistercoris TaxID=2785916 RepID=A0A931IGW1_9NOCA|nr:MCE family protein [Nocardia bovistercoris]MBH0781527.1 MCE family protein [Nocardia bovistercoris]
MSISSRVGRTPRRVVILVGVLVAALVAFGVYSGLSRLGKTNVTIFFPSTNGLYTGDDVRVLGVKVGRIDSVEPGREQVRVEVTLDRGVDIPEDARAVIISPSLVSARFIQLAPAYTGGPKLADGATIPIGHTAVPVEWDDIKAELSKLATALGPVGDDQQGSFGRVVDTAAANLDGNGQRFRDTLRDLSATLTTLSDGRTDLFATVRNLQKFVEVLSSSNEQIVQFGSRLASVSEVLGDTATDLGAGLDNLDIALADLKRFLDGGGDELTEGVGRLAAVTKQLNDKRPELERVLHSGPTALVNFYQIYKPAQGTLAGAVALNNTADPLSFLCGSIRALEYDNSDRSADLCAQYLAPIISSVAMNYAPIMLNPATGVQAFPNQIVYSDPSLEGRVETEVTVPNGFTELAIPGGRR